MGHAKSLRVIGQCLDEARVLVFDVEKDGSAYLVSVHNLSSAREWILRNAVDSTTFSQAPARSANHRRFCFNPADISRLDSEAQKQRIQRSSANQQNSKNLAQALRALGDHLDISEATSFRLDWRYDDAVIEYQERDGRRDSRTFTIEKLERLGFHSRFRRSAAGRYGFAVGKNLQPSDKLATPEFPNWSPAKPSRFEWTLPNPFRQNKKK